jgi:Cu-Zn family superoxide dismutase
MFRLILSVGMAAAIPVSALMAQVTRQVHAAVIDADGKRLGTAHLREGPTGVLMVLEVNGLSPGWHGMHFHQTGDCSAGFKNAGGHILRAASGHGDHAGHGGNAHAGGHLASGLLNEQTNDAGALPNIYVAPDRTASVETHTTFVSFHGRDGRPPLLDADGSSLIIHEGPEDQTGAKDTVGKRVACAAIR